MDEAVAQAAAEHPDRPVEVWAEDEHRLGLKPVRRRVWAPVGMRPVALGHHRYQWLHAIAFVQPTSGETVWYLASGLSKPFFAALLASFARRVRAGRERHIILVLDNGSNHTSGVSMRAIQAAKEHVSVFWIPKYTSEQLNDVENLWGHLKDDYFCRMLAKTAQQFQEEVIGLLDQLSKPGGVRRMLKPHTNMKVRTKLRRTA